MVACIQASWLLPSWWTSTQFNDHRRNYHFDHHIFMIMMMMAIHQGLMLKMKTRIQNIDIHPVQSITIKDVRSTVERNGGIMLKKLMRFLPWFLIPSFLNGSEFLQEQKRPNICCWNLKPNRKHDITNVIFAPIVWSGSTFIHFKWSLIISKRRCVIITAVAVARLSPWVAIQSKEPLKVKGSLYHLHYH